MRDIVGRTVEARTHFGLHKGEVLEVIERQDAEGRIMKYARDNQRPMPLVNGRLKAGRYLIVKNVPYPVRRARCKVVR